jgi:hypothetical protein
VEGESIHYEFCPELCVLYINHYEYNVSGKFLDYVTAFFYGEYFVSSVR